MALVPAAHYSSCDAPVKKRRPEIASLPLSTRSANESEHSNSVGLSTVSMMSPSGSLRGEGEAVGDGRLMTSMQRSLLSLMCFGMAGSPFERL